MTRTTVHLIRHGEVFNPESVLYGRLPDYHLSDLGQQMADVVAEALAGRDITHLVASPLERAQETMAPIAAKLNLPVLTDDRVIEAENRFEGRNVGVGPKAFLNPADWHLLWNPFRPSWGEPYVDIAARMSAAVEDARAASEGHEAVIVSHQLPVWIARCTIEGRRYAHDPRSRVCTLASVTSVLFDDGEVLGVEYSEPAAHLLPASTAFVGGA